MAILRLILLLGAALLLVACPRPGVQPLAGLAARLTGGLASGPHAPRSDSGAMPTDRLVIRGRVENARFKVSASFGEFAPNSVVSILDPVSGMALGTAITEANGTFTMQLPVGWVPDDQGKAYILEAVKGGRINGAHNFAGAPAIRMRTLLTWKKAGLYWMSLSSVASESAIVINRSTTAISVGVALRQATKTQAQAAERAIFSQFLEGSLAIGTPDNSIPPPTPDTYTKPANNSITVAEFHTLFGLVDQALLNGQDPVGSIALVNQNVASPQYALVPQGFMLAGFDKVKGPAGTRVTAMGGGFPLDANQIQIVFAGGAVAQALTVDNTGSRLVFDVPIGARTGPTAIRVTLPGSPSVLTLTGPTFTVPTSDGHMVVDPAGNLWVAGRANNTLWTLSQTGTWTRKASGIGLAGPRGLTLKIDQVASTATAVFVSWGSGTVFKLFPGANQTPVAMSQGATNKLKNPWGIAAEASGSYLVSSFGADEVRRVFENGVSVGVASVSQPTGIAIDPQGNAYVASWLDGVLYRIASASPFTLTPVMTGLARPGGVAIQPDGTIVVACYGSDSLARLAPDGTVLPPLLPRGIHQGVIDVASDDQGRLFVGAFDSHTIARLDPGGAVVDLALAPRNVWGLAANSTGDIAVGIINDLWPYAARPRDTRIYVVPFASGAYQPFVPIDGFGNPEAVAWDATGDLYVADAASDRLIKISRPPAGPRTTLVQGIGRVAQLAVDQAGKVLMAGLDGPLSIWNPASPGILTRFGPGRTFWAIARDGATGKTYLAGPRDGQIVEVAADLSSVRNVATVPGATGLAVANGSLYALVYGTGDLVQVNTTTGATTVAASVGTTSVDVAALAGDFYVATANGAIRRVPITGGTPQTLVQLPGAETPRRMIGRSVPALELYVTTASASSVVKISNLSGAASATTVATFAPFSGTALPAEVGSGTIAGTTGLAFDSIGNLMVAQSNAGASRIFRLAPGFAEDQTATAAWATLDAPIMGMVNLASGGNDTLLTANPQEGLMSTPGALDASIGFAIRTSDRGVTSLGPAIGRLLGVAPVPPSGANFYLLSSPTLNSTAISLVSGGSWRRIPGTAFCCGANHPFVDAGGILYVPSYTGTLGVRSFTVGGAVGQEFTGESFGAMSGVVTDQGRASSFIGGSLGGGAGNAPLLRFGAAGASALDNWPYEPSF